MPVRDLVQLADHGACTEWCTYVYRFYTGPGTSGIHEYGEGRGRLDCSGSIHVFLSRSACPVTVDCNDSYSPGLCSPCSGISSLQQTACPLGWGAYYAYKNYLSPGAYLCGHYPSPIPVSVGPAEFIGSTK